MTHNILIIGPSWVGDMVMAQTLFRLLKQLHPEANIDVLAPEWTFSLLSRMPEVSRAIPLPFQHGELKLLQRYRLAHALRLRGYAQAIVLPNSFKSALIPWLSGIPKRTGWVGECRYGLLNDARRLDKKRYPLMIQQFMALALPEGEPLPPLQHYYPQFKACLNQAHVVAAQLGVSLTEKPVLAICPGAAFGSAKCWPPAYYAAVAKQKIADGFGVWLFGSAKDKTITTAIMALTDNQCVDLAGRCPLPETMDLFSGVAGVLSNDSGLLHLAAALNRPVIAIYGPTSPAFTPPLSTLATVLTLDLPCQPCFKRSCPLTHHRCMRELTPNKVLMAISQWKTVCVS